MALKPYLTLLKRLTVEQQQISTLPQIPELLVGTHSRTVGRHSFQNYWSELLVGTHSRTAGRHSAVENTTMAEGKISRPALSSRKTTMAEEKPRNSIQEDKAYRFFGTEEDMRGMKKLSEQESNGGTNNLEKQRNEQKLAVRNFIEHVKRKERPTSTSTIHADHLKLHL
jgi:hypothetical protein